jgi:hypothetical protein
MTVPTQLFADSSAVRTHLVETLRRDLVGPRHGGDVDLQAEILPARPSRWYLTGYLVPRGAPAAQRTGLAETEGELGTTQGGADGLDDGGGDAAGTRQAYRPSSIGLSVLLPGNAETIDVTGSWGEYQAHPALDLPSPAAGQEVETAGETGSGPGAEPAADDPASLEADGQGTLNRLRWRRIPRQTTATLPLPEDGALATHTAPGARGVELAVLCRPTRLLIDDVERDVRAVTVFLVNSKPALEQHEDEAYLFQAALELHHDGGLVSRPDLRVARADDWDAQISDLHYADAGELAVGHNVAAEWDGDGTRACTAWMPQAMVPRVEPHQGIAGERRMEVLGALADQAAARAALDPLPAEYRSWIAAQRLGLGPLIPRRSRVAAKLLDQADEAAGRIEAGIASLADPQVLAAFKLANRAVAIARRRGAAQERRRRGAAFDPAASEEPRWYPFQLAFILIGLRGLTEPGYPDREVVDLLFFPTGGGKTEAYLGLGAFTIALRRLRNTGLTGAGLTVLMRYTLRLLTLDQLGRAAAVVCAMELERQAEPARWGEWPIEIALWVGQAATPNRMGMKGQPDPKRRTVRTKVLDFKAGKKRDPLPIKRCPWCGSEFTAGSFELKPDYDAPRELHLLCADPTRQCDFHAGKRRPLPIQAVDEPIYCRLPAFMIATVDKFAGMPWHGEIGAFFGGADRYDQHGFYGANDPGRGAPLLSPLLPPELIIQDELHLISGPLGTMAGLYEVALDRLCVRGDVRPKIIASTATVRRAEAQIRALFDRDGSAVFPPPGPDRKDSFFARMRDVTDPSGRLYIGVAAPGGSPKVNFKRGAITLMAAAERTWESGAAAGANPADPYMTLVCYFNALRELGSARNMIEGEIQSSLARYGQHRRVGEVEPGLRSRQIDLETRELTSRESTDKVSETKERLAIPFGSKHRIDVALATNMISVGLDITRLGLMLVSGQPKTVSEYIQATSRVGRDDRWPGLVVVLLNTNKPRDRSHYERFRAWHEAFYRGVEAVSVTPFSPRALDRALAAVAIGLGRLGEASLTGDPCAGLIRAARPAVDALATTFGMRAQRSDQALPAAEAATLGATVAARTRAMLEEWSGLAKSVEDAGGTLVYARQGKRLLREATPGATDGHFRAPRSLRDVEARVLVKVLNPMDGTELI